MTGPERYVVIVSPTGKLHRPHVARSQPGFRTDNAVCGQRGDLRVIHATQYGPAYFCTRCVPHRLSFEEAGGTVLR